MPGIDRPDREDFAGDERQLLAAVAAGDEQAFRVLVDAYWRRVYFNTLALVKSHTVAQELTQDIFLKIWMQRDKLLEINSLKGYIYVVGRNQVLAALRKKIKETVTIDKETALEDLLVPDLQLEGKEAYRILLEGMEQLTPRQRAIFTMSRIEGLSHEEIARRLELSRNTVKVHMVLALNFLRTWLAERLDYMPAIFFSLVSLLKK
jgi:RNA polymerase sigma-70 factor (ECF subfamily)